MTFSSIDSTADDQAGVAAARGQVALVRSLLVPGERLLAVVDLYGLRTGMIACTDGRVVILRRDLVFRRLSMQSIPLGRISAVSCTDRGRDLFGARSDFRIDLGGEAKQFAIRGGRAAQRVHDLLIRLLMLPPALPGPRGDDVELAVRA